METAFVVAVLIFFGCICLAAMMPAILIILGFLLKLLLAVVFTVGAIWFGLQLFYYLREEAREKEEQRQLEELRLQRYAELNALHEEIVNEHLNTWDGQLDTYRSLGGKQPGLPNGVDIHSGATGAS